MNWSKRAWDSRLLAKTARLAGDTMDELVERLPPLAHPLTFAGRLAAYFVERFGMSSDCRVVIGSGDNPQSKVLAPGILLSLGTSFVLMANGERPHVSANAMYDGLGRPFMFGCRTNGALVWERVRRDHGLAPDDFEASERALSLRLPGLEGAKGGEAAPSGASAMEGGEADPSGARAMEGGEGLPRIYQLERESFPRSEALDLGRRGDFEADYVGAVDSSLALMWLGSRPFASSVESLSVTGGGAASKGVLDRVAAIWRCPVVPIANAGAATGAALAAAIAVLHPTARDAVLPAARARAARAGQPIEPRPELVAAYHGSGGRAYLPAFEDAAREAGISF